MKTWLKALIAAVVLFAGTAAYIYFFVYNKAHEDYEFAYPEFSLKAKILYDAYKHDSSSAVLMYGGKVIEIEGIVDTLENYGDTLLIAVFIFEQGMFGPQGVRCSFMPKYNEAAIKLKANTPIKLKGVCQGYNDSDVIIESASILE